MHTPRSHPSVLRPLAYLVALAATAVLALTVVGSSPYLLDRVVPENLRTTVAAFGSDAPRLTGAGDELDPRPGSSVLGVAVTAASPLDGGSWSQRRLSDYRPPRELTAGTDFAVQTTAEGFIAHWPCEAEIAVRSFGAPQGSAADLAWAVETVATASGLALRYVGPGSPDELGRDGEISVTYGDHPRFHDGETVGVGGPTVWDGGLITRGAVTLRPDQISATAGDASTRALTAHELMHAIGIDHAAEQQPEVMAPTAGPIPRPDPGLGDRFALKLVGCR